MEQFLNSTVALFVSPAVASVPPPHLLPKLLQQSPISASSALAAAIWPLLIKEVTLGMIVPASMPNMATIINSSRSVKPFSPPKNDLATFDDNLFKAVGPFMFF